MTESAGAVIGLNFGLSYSSIASINPHGRADVIANEDGERQLATRIAFNEDQVYIGNQATPQLVRNAANVIDRFVGFLGRDFASLSNEEKQRASSPVIDVNGVPSFQVTIAGAQQTLSAHDVAVRYLRSLHQTARDFLSGVPIAGAVIALPSQEFGKNEKQVQALKDAATEAGFVVLGLLPAAAAALVAYNLTSPLPASISNASSSSAAAAASQNKQSQTPSFREQLPTHPDAADGTAGGGVASANTPAYVPGTELDRIVLVLDMGGTSTSLTVLAARAGLYLPLASLADAHLGGQQIDDALVAYFAKEFTKKTKVALDLASNARAAAKLRNEAEVTKRSLSASNSAQCSVESLAEGIDFSGSVNRMRLDLLAADVYARVQERVQQVLSQAGLEPAQVHEVILAGGSSRLSGLVDRLAALFPEEGASKTPTHFTASIDSDQVIARGCAVQAQALVRLAPDAPERKLAADLLAGNSNSSKQTAVPTLARPVGLVVPSAAGQANGKRAGDVDDDKRVVDGKLFVTLFPARTPLPARRAFRLPIASSSSSASSGSVILSFAEGTEQVRTDTVAPPPRDPEDEDDDEEDEPEEVKTAFVKPDADRLVELAVPVGGSGAKSVLIELVAQASGAIDIEAQAGSGEKVSAQIAAA